MKRFRSRFYRREDGSVTLVAAILISTVFAGMAALIIDAGSLFVERRALVTAADAAALAGAMVLEDSRGLNTAGAIAAAKDIVVKNGVALEDATVTVTNRAVVIKGTADIRQVIDVDVRAEKSLFFARLFQQTSSTVTAHAAGTWGYTQKVAGGDILPLFVFENIFLGSSNASILDGKLMLHSEFLNGNWGYNDIFDASQMKEAIMGDSVDMAMEVNLTIGNITGKKIGFSTEFNTRFDNASTLSTPEERKTYMTGLVPIIDEEHVQQQGSTLVLPIKYFGIYEILDYMVEENVGTPKAFNPDYLSQREDQGKTGINYFETYGMTFEKGSVIGRFVGDPVPYIAVASAGDQAEPDTDKPIATYHKLVD